MLIEDQKLYLELQTQREKIYEMGRKVSRASTVAIKSKSQTDLKQLQVEEQETLRKIKILEQANFFIKKGDSQHSMRIVGQNFRLFKMSCDHYSHIVAKNENNGGIYIGSRPFAKVNEYQQYIPDANTNSTGVFTIQQFMKNTGSQKLCIISMLSEGEIISANGTAIKSPIEEYSAVNGSMIFPSDDIIRIALPLFDHTAIDPETNSLISLTKIMAAVYQAAALRKDGYDLLIHCYSGMERSIIFCTILLMIEQNLTPLEANNLVTQRRSIAKDLDHLKDPSLSAIIGRVFLHNLANNSELLQKYVATLDSDSNQINQLNKLLEPLKNFINDMSAEDYQLFQNELTTVRKYCEDRNIHADSMYGLLKNAHREHEPKSTSPSTDQIKIAAIDLEHSVSVCTKLLGI